jgi:predicted RNA-binding Zn-ribbon protein involved in translation (DUF1610 family)
MKGTGPFILLAVIGFWLLFFSIWDVVFDNGWMIAIVLLYVIFIIILLALMRSRRKRDKPTADSIEEFEKTLKGGLYHFKCPGCNGIFAIKKSKKNNKRYVLMTCPDCGMVGTVSPSPTSIEAEIPEKKSIKANFKCGACGEGITVWAEGTELYQNMKVYSCPFCGDKQPLRRF